MAVSDSEALLLFSTSIALVALKEVVTCLRTVEVDGNSSSKCRGGIVFILGSTTTATFSTFESEPIRSSQV